MDGKAVKLVQGRQASKKYEADAIGLAEKFSIYPEINLIDLDAAFGKGDNFELVKKICKICSCNCNVGGGIRTVKKAYELLKSGANKIIIGTMADKDFLSKLPNEKVIVAIDSKRGKIVKQGWKIKSKETPFRKVKDLQGYCSGFLYTFVDNEGTMKGIDISTIKELRKITGKRIMYAGGISGKGDILLLDRIEVDSVVGMSYYEKKIDISDCFAALLDFEKNKGLIPTIVKDKNGQILMLAYSTKESLIETLNTKKGVYYSRSRNRLWRKGETSGNTQELLRVNTDCDKDTLLFTVRQKGVACHKGEYSCFEEKFFSFRDLLEIINSRKGAKTYTDKLLKNNALLREKILEEAKEVANFRDRDNLKWEIADLLYFVSVLMAKNSIDFTDIEKELEARNFMKTYINSTKLR